MQGINEPFLQPCFLLCRSGIGLWRFRARIFFPWQPLSHGVQQTETRKWWGCLEEKETAAAGKGHSTQGSESIKVFGQWHAPCQLISQIISSTALDNRSVCLELSVKLCCSVLCKNVVVLVFGISHTCCKRGKCDAGCVKQYQFCRIMVRCVGVEEEEEEAVLNILSEKQ